MTGAARRGGGSASRAGRSPPGGTCQSPSHGAGAAVASSGGAGQAQAFAPLCPLPPPSPELLANPCVPACPTWATVVTPLPDQPWAFIPAALPGPHQFPLFCVGHLLLLKRTPKIKKGRNERPAGSSKGPVHGWKAGGGGLGGGRRADGALPSSPPPPPGQTEFQVWAPPTGSAWLGRMLPGKLLLPELFPPLPSAVGCSPSGTGAEGPTP